MLNSTKIIHNNAVGTAIDAAEVLFGAVYILRLLRAQVHYFKCTRASIFSRRVRPASRYRLNILTFQNAASAPRVMWQEPTISFILSRNSIESSAEMEEQLIIAVQAGLAILNKFSSRAQAIFSAGNPFILCWNFRVFMHGSRLLSNGRRHGSASIAQGTERFGRRRKQRTQRFPCVFRCDMWTARRYYLHLPLFERGSVIKA